MTLSIWRIIDDMISWELVWEIPFRVLPNLVSILLCWRKFRFSQVARGVEAYQDTCSDFDSVKKDGFPCLKSGITALGVVSAVISLSVSVIILTRLSGIPNIAYGGLFGGFFIIFICLTYTQELGSGAFTLRADLPRSRWRFFRFFGKNPALRANFLCLFIVTGFHLVIILFA